MMIFIAGISPKITVIDDTAVICPVCGLAQARFKRVDQYLSVFFIPLFRVKKGDPFLMCDRCERNVHEMGEEYHEFLNRQDAVCRHCGHSLHPDFQYCPFCGQKA